MSRLDTASLAAFFYNSLRERLAPRLSPTALNLIVGKVPTGARPHHSVHVQEVCRRTGSLADHLDTLENCRIGWGRVQSVPDRASGSHYLDVSVRPMTSILRRSIHPISPW